MFPRVSPVSLTHFKGWPEAAPSSRAGAATYQEIDTHPECLVPLPKTNSEGTLWAGFPHSTDIQNQHLRTNKGSPNSHFPLGSAGASVLSAPRRHLCPRG